MDFNDLSITATHIAVESVNKCAAAVSDNVAI